MTDVEALQKIATRLRIHSIIMTTEAGSGHPTTCMSMAEIGACLFFSEMYMNVKDPQDIGNDELVLSKGHAAPILWAMFAEAGIIKQQELMNLRKIDSDLEGHPTPRMPWIKAATGSLGQGLSVGLGMAYANKLLKSPSRVYVVTGDGELAEGSIWEAAGLAGHDKVANLCCICDVNRLAQSGTAMHEHHLQIWADKFKAFGWHAIIIDGHSVKDILQALEEARHEKERPTAIICKTFKGKGVSFLEDKDGMHGKPVSKEDLPKALDELGKMPEVAAASMVKPAHKVPAYDFGKVSKIKPLQYEEKEATRVAYGDALASLSSANKRVVALDGDVKNSTFSEKFLKVCPERFFECYIAEQNMVSIAVGLAAKGFIPFASTFAAFLARAHDSIRMAIYSFANIKIAGSHVGVSIGEDGPSQMGLEDLAIFRGLPNAAVLYPSDAYSASALTQEAANFKGIVYIRNSRPKTPILYDANEKFPIGGSKEIKKSENDKVTVIAAGVTLHEAVKAADSLEKEGISIRIIDAYSVKPLDVKGIQAAVSATGGKGIIVEDHYPEGGLGEAVMGSVKGDFVHLAVKDVPRSGKPAELLAMFKIDADAIIETVKQI